MAFERATGLTGVTKVPLIGMFATSDSRLQKGSLTRRGFLARAANPICGSVVLPAKTLWRTGKYANQWGMFHGEDDLCDLGMKLSALDVRAGRSGTKTITSTQRLCYDTYGCTCRLYKGQFLGLRKNKETENPNLVRGGVEKTGFRPGPMASGIVTGRRDWYIVYAFW